MQGFGLSSQPVPEGRVGYNFRGTLLVFWLLGMRHQTQRDVFEKRGDIVKEPDDGMSGQESFLGQEEKPPTVAKGTSEPVPDAYAKLGTTHDSFVAAPPAEQKQILGEALYPMISKIEPALAGKITGMLLDMDNRDILDM